MSIIRKDALRRTIYVLAGATIFLVLQKKEAPWVFVGIAGFIFSGCHLLVLLINAQHIYDDFFPPRVTNEETPSVINRYLYGTAIGIFVVGGITFLIEFNKMDNTILGIRLFWMAFLAGIGLFLVVVRLFKIISADVYFYANRRFGIYSCLLAGCVMLVPGITGILNRTLAASATECREYLVTDKYVGNKKGSHYIYCRIGNRSERLTVRRSFVNKVKPGTTVQLCTVKGFFGYDYVQGIKLP